MRVGWWVMLVGIGCSGSKDDGEPTGETAAQDTSASTETGDTGGPLTGPARVAAVLALQKDPTAGEAVYLDNCDICHGVAGEGAPSGPALTERLPPLTDEDIVTTIIEGSTGMTPFGTVLEDQEIANVFSYITGAFQ